MAVITVARQLGSGGDVIAGRTADTLGYQLADRRLVEEIAAHTDATPEEVEEFDEKGDGRIRHFLGRLLVPQVGGHALPLSSSAYFPEFGLDFPYVTDGDGGRQAAYLDRGSYQLLITTLIEELGRQGNVVLVGRGSQAILAHRRDVLHVKVVAPFEQRCDRVAAGRGVDRQRSRELVERHDRWRQHYLRNTHGIDWDDPLLYHLTINTGKVDEDAAVSLIVHAVLQRG